jgi:hypothetical protein
VENFAYLIYYYPKKVGKNGMIEFNIKTVKVDTDLTRAKKTFEDAVGLLKGPVPQKHSNCDYCCWIGDRLGFE